MSTPTMKLVIYIAPNSGEIHHAQARLYARLFAVEQLAQARLNMRDTYNARPQEWAECGYINYDGKLVSFHGPREALEELKAGEPLVAGAFYTYDYDPTQGTAYARMEGRKGDFHNIPKEKHMTHDQFINTCQTMQAYGGSFASRIADAALVADTRNKDRLIAAFPELFEKYGPGSDFYKRIS